MAIALRARETIETHVEASRAARQYGAAYKLALTNFARRHADYQPSDIDAFLSAESNENVHPRMENIPRNSLTARESHRAAMLEQLLWAEHLAGERGQRRIALRRMLRTAVRNPFMPEPLAMLLRQTLPSPLLRAAGGVMRAVFGEPLSRAD